MDEFIRRVIVEPFGGFMDRVLAFLPNLLTAVLVFVAGLVLSAIIRFVLQRLLCALGLDRHAEKSGLMDVVKKGGITVGFSGLIAGLVYWLLVIMFLIISIATMNLPQLDRLLSEFFLYLPSIFAAIAIAFIGYVFSNFLAKAVLVSAVNAGLGMSGTLSKTVRIMVLLLTATMALEQLGIGKGTTLIVFSITFGGLVFALAIAFGLGAKDIAREFLEKRLKEDKKEEHDGISHI